VEKDEVLNKTEKSTKKRTNNELVKETNEKLDSHDHVQTKKKSNSLKV